MGKSGAGCSYRIPLKKCVVCSGNLSTRGITTKAKVFGFHLPKTVNIASTLCCTASCRRSYGPNWMWAKGSKQTKLNVIKLNQLKEDKRRPGRPLFVTSQCGFDLDFLEYHMQLLFRGGTGWRTTAYANAMVYPHGMNANAWRQRLSEGIKYYMLLKELTPLNLCGNIVIGSIGTVNLNSYRKYILDKIFPKDSPDSRFVVVDGHSKVDVFWVL